MKQFFISLLAVAFVFTACAQTEGTAKLYGYKEPVISGVVPKTIDESGKQIEGAHKTGFNYFIYLVSSSRVYPSEMWINGNPYSVSVQTITNTPVERENLNNPTAPKTTELVPKTTKKVIMLKPAPAVDDKLSENGKNLSGSNELVVVYKLNGKFYYNTLTSLTSLEAVATQ